MRRLRRWQSRLDCPHRPSHPNTWARKRWVRRWAVLMAHAGNPRPSLCAWIVLAVCLPGIGPWGAAAALAGLLAYKAIKRHTARPRPFERHAHITAWAPAPDPHSFPSGHTLNAVVVAMSVVFAYPWLAPLGAAWIVSMGISRVVLGLHYPRDVVAGGLLGAMLGACAIGCAQAWPIGGLLG